MHGTTTHHETSRQNARNDSRSSTRNDGRHERPGSDTIAPAVRLLDACLAEAVQADASDLHFEPDRSGLRIRIRVDGHLRDLAAPPSSLVPALLTRIRLLARADLAERRLPQDGRFTFEGPDGRRVDVRAAFLPVARGEKIALRLLRHGGSAPDLADVGMPSQQRCRFEAALARSNGMVLVAGPTGSGKSTTLYAAVAALRSPARSVVTVEDPVELDVEGVSQVPIDDEVGRSFANVLRALLRQDPDVLMVGEIRDGDSAQIACRAALTGHLVLTSVHASDAREALLRLPEMGVPSYLIDATLSLVVAQRLVRRLCRHCRCVSATAETTSHRLLFEGAGLAFPRATAAAAGCDRCGNSGYRGRIGLFEMAAGRHDAPVPLGPGSLGASGLVQVTLGETTIEEVLAHCPQPGVEPLTRDTTQRETQQ